MRAVPSVLLVLSVLLGGCADPGAVVRPGEDPTPPPAEASESLPWLWYTRGCGRCGPGERLETTLLYGDGTVAWFRWGFGADATAPPSFHDVPAGLAERFTVAWTHLEPHHGEVSPSVEEAMLAGLGHEARQRLRNEAGAALSRVEGPPPEAQCHDCAYDGLGALPDGPHGRLVRGDEAPGWTDLRMVMEELRAGFGTH